MDQVSKNISTSSVARPSNIYPNLDFWFENKPSGNPAANCNHTKPKFHPSVAEKKSINEKLNFPE
jgi:hypothetical protein